MGSILRWFDLYEIDPGGPHGYSIDKVEVGSRGYKLALIYGAIILGVLGQGLLDFVAGEQTGALAGFFVWRRIIPAIVVSIVILPSVYRNVMSQRQKEALPFLVELATVFSLGIGYKSIFDAAVG